MIAGGQLVLVPCPLCAARCLFPATSALITHRVPRHQLGQTLGVQQAFGGVARVIAPIWATAAFQGLGTSVPFYIAGGVVALVTVLAFQVRPRAPIPEAA